MQDPGDHRYLTVAGKLTHYVVAGQGPPVILLHGLGASWMAWRYNIGPLSRYFRVYAPDIPGHGASEKPPIPYTIAAGSQYVHDFLDALGLQQATLVGNSMGGLLALRTALEHPCRVAQLVLAGAAGLGRDLPSYIRVASLPLVGDVLWDLASAGLRVWMSHTVEEPSPTRPQQPGASCLRPQPLAGAKRVVLNALRNEVTLRGLRSQNVLLGRLPELQVPALLVWGLQDRVTPIRHAYTALSLSPKIRLAAFAGCGHWPQWERAREFNHVVTAFLDQESDLSLPKSSKILGWAPEPRQYGLLTSVVPVET